ncbi:hypothetical protein HDV04_003719 [Boothiomyces sp. JEL0838]|nr:hypothetical protein HDV04_003719 [Boothiomyces sp. JEL0838]
MTGDPLLTTLPSTLKRQVQAMIDRYPDTLPTVSALLDHFSTDQVHKKPKLLENFGKSVATITDISVSLPIRKKASVVFYEKHICLAVGASTEFALQVQDLKHVACFVTPSKSKLHWTIVFIHKDVGESILFGVDDSDTKFKVQSELKLVKLKPKQIVQEIIQKYYKLQFIEPLPKIFPETEVAVKCFLKAKEGMLVFFKEGLFFGIKKPIMFYEFNDILGIEIVSITGRTFNILVTDKDENQTEFSMIDYEIYDGVAKFINLINHRTAESDEEVSREEQAPIAHEESEDEDYAQSEADSEESEDEDSDDGSISINSESDGEKDIEGSDQEQETEDDEPKMSKGMQAQIDAIEQQRKSRKPFAMAPKVSEERHSEPENDDEEDELLDD